MNIDETLSLHLLAGDFIKIENVGNIYPLTLKEIKAMDMMTYNYFLSVLCFELDNRKNDETMFDNILRNCSMDENYSYLVLNALSSFFKEKITLEKGKFYIGEIQENRCIDNSNYEKIRYILQLQNCLQNTIEDYNPANEEARKMIERIKKGKANKPTPKNNSNLASIVSGVVWKSKNVDIFNVWNLTIYQLYDALYRINLLDDFDNVMFAYYTGNIRKEDIDFKNLSWVKKFET